MIKLAIILLSANVSETGEREMDVKAGLLRKYESCRVLTGEFDRVTLPSTDTIACAKSSREVCSEQSITACERPNVFDATYNVLET